VIADGHAIAPMTPGVGIDGISQIDRTPSRAPIPA
jgi:hypothetical protein